jgi:hypothetical protein
VSVWEPHICGSVSLGSFARIIIRGPRVLNRRMPRQQVPVPGVEICNTPIRALQASACGASARNRSMCRRAASRPTQHSRLNKANRHRRMTRASPTVALPSGSGRGAGPHSTACAHNDSSGDVRRRGGWRGDRGPLGVRRRPVVQWPLRRWGASARTMGRSQRHRRPQEHHQSLHRNITTEHHVNVLVLETQSLFHTTLINKRKSNAHPARKNQLPCDHGRASALPRNSPIPHLNSPLHLNSRTNWFSMTGDESGVAPPL